MKNGQFAWPPDEPSTILGMLVVRDGDVVYTDMEVTLDDIKRVCYDRSLHFKTVYHAIEMMTPEQHTLFIDAEKHRESLRNR